MTRRSKQGPLAAALLGLLCLAPGAGNIGSCGQAADPLDAIKFHERKALVDCSRCTECGLATDACTSACEGRIPQDPSFPSDCYPLVHDGEVCLDALHAATCGAYASFVADEGATIPTECDFCPVDEGGDPVRSDP